MEKIESENLLHRAFSVFLFNSKNQLLLQVLFFDHVIRSAGTYLGCSEITLNICPLNQVIYTYIHIYEG